MAEQHHQIRVRGTADFAGGLAPDVGGPLLDAVGASVDGAVRMAFLGRSRSPGRRLTWLNEAAAVRLRDIDRGDDLVLHFTARPFGDIPELAHEMYAQTELWAAKPAPDWSAVDALAAVIEDVAAERRDSTRFDVSLLRQVQRFQKAIGDGVDSIAVEARHRQDDLPPGFVVLDPPLMQHARALSAATPRSREVRIDGVLDMIRQSTRSIGIKLDDGEEVRGILVDGDVGQARSLFGKRVSVQGSAVFRPSGRLLRVDAKAMVPCEGGSGFWSKLPRAKAPTLANVRQRSLQTASNGVNAFFGRWSTGSLGDEELLELLGAGQ
jgi:hypothetical protein